MTAHDMWTIARRAGSQFVEDDAMTLGAAISFYAALSLAPLLMILMWIGSMLGTQAQQALVGRLEQTAGPQASHGINLILQNVHDHPSAGTVTGIIGIVATVLSATAVFAQLQVSMNRLWDVKAASGQAIWGWLRKRLLGVGLILAILLILLASLALTTALSAAFSGSGLWWGAASFVVTAAVFVPLFALIYKFLPDVKIDWKYVWIGAGITAVLFALGKWGIGFYLGRTGIGSSYGAAGALIVLLVWIYYSSLILFFGAELTQAYARAQGQEVAPDEHAVWADDRRPPPRGTGERGRPGGEAEDWSSRPGQTEHTQPDRSRSARGYP